MNAVTIQLFILFFAIIHVFEEYKFGWISWAQQYAKKVTKNEFVIFNILFILSSILNASI
jgi:hypothetical protein